MSLRVQRHSAGWAQRPAPVLLLLALKQPLPVGERREFSRAFQQPGAGSAQCAPVRAAQVNAPAAPAEPNCGWTIFFLCASHRIAAAQDRVKYRAMQLRDMLTRLGPTFIKAGQVRQPVLYCSGYFCCILQYLKCGALG